MSNDLCHYGILGMRWGVRRFEDRNGHLTEAGKKRYGVGGLIINRHNERDNLKRDIQTKVYTKKQEIKNKTDEAAEKAKKVAKTGAVIAGATLAVVGGISLAAYVKKNPGALLKGKKAASMAMLNKVVPKMGMPMSKSVKPSYSFAASKMRPTSHIKKAGIQINASKFNSLDEKTKTDIVKYASSNNMSKIAARNKVAQNVQTESASYIKLPSKLESAKISSKWHMMSAKQKAAYGNDYRNFLYNDPKGIIKDRTFHDPKALDREFNASLRRQWKRMSKEQQTALGGNMRNWIAKERENRFKIHRGKPWE